VFITQYKLKLLFPEKFNLGTKLLSNSCQHRFLYNCLNSYVGCSLRTLDLEEEIRRVIGELDPEICQQVISNFVIRTETCQ